MVKNVKAKIFYTIPKMTGTASHLTAKKVTVPCPKREICGKSVSRPMWARIREGIFRESSLFREGERCPLRRRRGPRWRGGWRRRCSSPAPPPSRTACSTTTVSCWMDILRSQNDTNDFNDIELCSAALLIVVPIRQCGLTFGWLLSFY